MKENRLFISSIGVILSFAALAKGAHDLWAATLAHLAIGTAFVAFLIHRAISHKSLQWSWMIPSLVVLGVASLSVLGAPNPAEAFMSLKDIFFSFLLFFIATNVLREDHDLDLLARFLVPVFWVQAIVSITQGHEAPLSNNPSTLINPNLQAAFLLAWWPIVLDRTLDSMLRPSKMRWYWLSAFSAVLISFALTWSLSAWAVFAICLAFWTQQMGVSKRIAFTGAFAVALFFFMIKMFPSIFQGQQPNSFLNRVAWWETAMNMFRHNIWTGVGLGNFPSAFLAFKVPVEENTLSAHSWFFQLLGEMGLLGVVLLTTAFGCLFQATKGFSEKSNLQKSYFLGGASALLYCLMNIGGEYFLIRIIIPLFLFTSCHCLSRVFKPRLSLAILFAGMFILSLPTLITPFLASRHFVSGQIYISEGKIDLAEKSFQIAAELDPTQWQAHGALARIAYEKSLYSQKKESLLSAIQLQEKAIRYNKLNGRLYWELGHYLTTSGRGAEAEQYFQKARDLGFIFSSFPS